MDKALSNLVWPLSWPGSEQEVGPEISSGLLQPGWFYRQWLLLRERSTTHGKTATGGCLPMPWVWFFGVILLCVTENWYKFTVSRVNVCPDSSRSWLIQLNLVASQSKHYFPRGLVRHSLPYGIGFGAHLLACGVKNTALCSWWYLKMEKRWVFLIFSSEILHISLVWLPSIVCVILQLKVSVRVKQSPQGHPAPQASSSYWPHHYIQWVLKRT